jgi:uncharacterized protein YcgI (DUF1989 family)
MTAEQWSFDDLEVRADGTLLGPTPLQRRYYEHLAERLPDARWRSSVVLDDFGGAAIEARAGELVRVELAEAPQIVSLFPFNPRDPDERYWHQSSVREGFFLTRYTRLWGSLARYRPLATVLEDTVTARGGNAAPGLHHPILAGLGTPREWQTEGGADGVKTTWEQFAALLTARGISLYHLTESIGLFQKCSVNVPAQRFERVATDAVRGDRLTFFSEIDLCLLFALSPYGDGSHPASELGEPRPRPVRISVSEPLAAPLPWPYPGVPYPDLSLYLDDDGARSDEACLTPGIPNVAADST